jgi:ATP-dependent protease ClpP protease subunit
MKNRLMMLLAKNKQIAKPCALEVTGGDATLYLYDAIVSTQAEADWYGGVSAEALVPQIRSVQGGNLTLRINSPGGDVFAAQAIVAAIRDCGAKVTAVIDGLAASAATVIATAADSIEMSDGALFMIHCGWCGTVGNANDMRATAALLDKVDATICDQYAKRTGMTCEAVMALMQAETWMTAQESVDAGFVNAVCAPSKTKNEWDLSAYSKAPSPVALAEPEPAPEPAPEVLDPQQREHQARQVRMLIATHQ